MVNGDCEGVSCYPTLLSSSIDRLLYLHESRRGTDRLVQVEETVLGGATARPCMLADCRRGAENYIDER